MRQGTIESDGPSDQIYEQYGTERVFQFRMNICSGQFDKGTDQFRFLSTL